MSNHPYPVLLVFMEITLHYLSVRKCNFARTMLLVVLETTFKSIPVHAKHSSLAMALALLPTAFVTASVCVVQYSFAIVLFLPELPFIPIACFVIVFTSAFFDPFHEIAFVSALFIMFNSVPVSESTDPRSRVNIIPIIVFKCPLPMVKPISVFSLISLISNNFLYYLWLFHRLYFYSQGLLAVAHFI